MPPPRPSLSLTICSLAALFLCAALCASCTAVILHPWGVQRLGGLLLLPGFLGLGLTQYAGTFQAKPARAEMVARLYSFAGGFMVIGLVCLLFDIAGSGEHPSWPVIAVGAFFLVFALWGRIGGRLNREWGAELRRFDEAQETESESTTRHGHPLVWITTCTIFLLATGAVYAALMPRSGEHVDPKMTPLLSPEGASDVCYWIYVGDSVFEFSISEQGFLNWAEEQIQKHRSEFDGMKAVEGSEAIPIYQAWLPGTPQPHQVVIERGYYHGWKEPSKRVQYAYDLETGRAYYAATSELSWKRLDPAP